VTVGTLDGGAASRQFMIVMDLDGSVNGRMAYGADAIDTLVAMAIDDESTLRAVLVVPDYGDERSPTLRGYGDHRDGPAFDVRRSRPAPEASTATATTRTTTTTPPAASAPREPRSRDTARGPVAMTSG